MKSFCFKSLGLIVVVILLILFLPYINFFEPEMELKLGDQFIDQIVRNHPIYILLISPIFYPLILFVESSVFKGPKAWHRLMFFIQAIHILIGGYFVMIIMTYHPVCGRYSVGVNYYLTIIYLIVGFVWNLMLGFLYTDKTKIFTKWFYGLTSIKPEGNKTVHNKM